MKTLSARWAWSIYLILTVLSPSRARAVACETIALPTVVKRLLDAKFAGWKIVTPEVLRLDDQKIWKECCSSECPGVIRGHFTGRQIEYTVSLVRGSSETLEQQIVFFKARQGGYTTLVIDAPSHVDVIGVLRKVPPGEYRDPDTGRSVRVSVDGIGLSEIEGGAVLYYWDGKQFQSIVTSV